MLLCRIMHPFFHKADRSEHAGRLHDRSVRSEDSRLCICVSEKCIYHPDSDLIFTVCQRIRNIHIVGRRRKNLCIFPIPDAGCPFLPSLSTPCFRPDTS